MNAHEFTTLEAFRESSSPERWAAFLQLARYMTAAPSLRLGQAVCNALIEGPCPDLFYMSDEEAREHCRKFGKYVIRFTDKPDCYNRGNGHEVCFAEATRYNTPEAAEAVAVDLRYPNEHDSGAEIIREGEVD